MSVTKNQEGIKIGDFVGDYQIGWEVEIYPCIVLEKGKKGLKVCEIFSRVGDRIRWLDQWWVFDHRPLGSNR